MLPAIPLHDLPGVVEAIALPRWRSKHAHASRQHLLNASGGKPPFLEFLEGVDVKIWDFLGLGGMLKWEKFANLIDWDMIVPL